MARSLTLHRLSGFVSILLISAVVCMTCAADSEGRDIHLFILSGQSNMAGLDPEISFEPAVKKALAGDDVVVVKYALGGRPIHRWYKKWYQEEGEKPKATGDIYDRLMARVNEAVQGRIPSTVTFVWMQGERDARERYGEFYPFRLKGLIRQLRADMGRQDINFVIGRLSDYAVNSKRYLFWNLVRGAQVETAESDPHGAWIDTDDLNGPDDDLHYTDEGYEELGRRFANKSIELIRRSGMSNPARSYADLGVIK